MANRPDVNLGIISTTAAAAALPAKTFAQALQTIILPPPDRRCHW